MTTVLCIGPFEVDKLTKTLPDGRVVGAGYDLFRNGDTGRAFVGHHRDKRDCERVAKRTLANDAAATPKGWATAGGPTDDGDNFADAGQG